ncbi:hypothetical protein GQ53DRAFT_748346 [Thozetella sp. PMI_491]|nr:hypothetical protein GQ53DRAFT_748346 [Thozetella sp. PMI_491]
MAPPLVVLKQHTDEEWEVIRPTVERLYHSHPLSTVMRVVENKHRFKASPAMFKRKLQAWGLRKNARSIPSAPAGVVASTAGTARYLPQNAIDETMHTLLDLLAPWISHTYVLGERPGHISQLKCPPRAYHIYDDFAHCVVVAADAFESGDPAWGDTMRQAFLAVERALAPQSHSIFTLHSLLFGVAVLSEAGMPAVAKMLVTHAANLVTSGTRAAARLPASALAASTAGQGQDFADDDDSHISHPFPQMLKRLEYLALTLDDTMVMQAFFLIWLAYLRACNDIKTVSIRSNVKNRVYWSTILRKKRHWTPSSSKEQRWIDTKQLELNYLNRLLHYAEATLGVDDDYTIVQLESLVSMYSFCRHEKFEETALDLLERCERKKRGSRDPANICQLSCSTHLELASYYRGDMDKTMMHFNTVIGDANEGSWESTFASVWLSWKQEADRLVTDMAHVKSGIDIMPGEGELWDE